MKPSEPIPEVSRDALVTFLDEYLEASAGSDYCPNGLQVEGRDTIRRVVTGVSSCLELFEAASERGADAVLVHHGIFWRGDTPTVTGVQYRRLRALLEADLNLIAYHLPLDRHMEVGNNAVAARALGLEGLKPFCRQEALPLGVSGRFPAPVPRQRVLESIADLFRCEPQVFAFGPDVIDSIGLVSGAAGRCFQTAIDDNIDLFVTGEPEEWVMHLARDARANFIAAGHHATERLGIRALGEKVQAEFGIEVEFVDLPNPV
jgi:dinuclear metal center YbgI/SA1388 family protein